MRGIRALGIVLALALVLFSFQNCGISYSTEGASSSILTAESPTAVVAEEEPRAEDAAPVEEPAPVVEREPEPQVPETVPDPTVQNPTETPLTLEFGGGVEEEELGPGTAEDRFPEFDPINPPDPFRIFSKLALLESTTCARAGNQPFCWGSNRDDLLGVVSPQGLEDRAVLNAKAADDRILNLGQQIASIDGSDSHVCLLMTTGAVYCFGSNLQGELGNGTRASTALVIKVAGLGTGASLGPASQIALGSGSNGQTSSYALVNGGVVGWGFTYKGVIEQPAFLPEFPAGSNVQYIAVTERALCAVVNFEARCIGNRFPNGRGVSSSTTTPVTLTRTEGSPIKGVRQIVMGGSADRKTICLLVNDGVLCAGEGAAGELGNGAAAASNAFTIVRGLGEGAKVRQLAGGKGFRPHFCALTEESQIKCWGPNTGGALGAGLEPPSAFLISGPCGVGLAEDGERSGLTNCLAEPTDVLGFTQPLNPAQAPVTVDQIQVGRSRTCALLTNNAVFCWGDGRLGQVGNGRREAINVIPQRVIFPPP